MPTPIPPANDLLALLRQVPPRQRTLLVGIDGRGGSGKSTLARQLERSASDLTVVEFDDFYLRLQERKGRAFAGRCRNRREL
jgi:uridine kinase